MKKSSLSLDRRLLECGSLAAHDRRVERFPYWGDRLFILREAWEESRSATPSQWWNDRRSSNRYTLMFTAICVGLSISLGLISFVIAAVQLYYSYQTWKTVDGISGNP